MYRFIPIFATVFIWLCAGCGLSNYEKQMDKHSLRFAKMDEEDRLLGRPLNSPTSSDPESSGYDWPVSFFFRPPTRFAAEPVPREAWFDPELKMHRYMDTKTHSPPFCMFFVARHVAENAKQEAAGEYTRSQFHDTVKQNLENYFEALITRPPMFRETRTFPYPPVKVKWERSKLQFHKYTWIDPVQDDVTFFAFFHSRNDAQAAVIFQVPSNVNFTKEMDASLKSIHLGWESGAAMKEYLDFHPHN